MSEARGQEATASIILVPLDHKDRLNEGSSEDEGLVKTDIDSKSV